MELTKDLSSDPMSDAAAPHLEVVRDFFATKVPWRARVLSLALIIGLLCGVVAAAYEFVMDFVLEVVWKEHGPALFTKLLPNAPQWIFIPIVCITFGALTGLLIRLLGEPMANLPGVVKAAHADSALGYQEAPAMAVISITSITAAGGLGPEAPLVSIGGGLATLVAELVDLSEAETLFVTMSGMASGLAAFFGEPVGGALFACEVLHRYGLEYYEAVVPTVVAGLACNWSFRVVAGLPQEPIWRFPAESEPIAPFASIYGLLWGFVGGGLGWGWMRFTNVVREKVLVPLKLGPRHVLKGAIGGTIIGICGMLLPEVLFWAEHEAQNIIDHGATPLPHVWPKTGALGVYSLESPKWLFAIGIVKLFMISITVLAGYRGGFIFPFMFAGHAIGTGLYYCFVSYGVQMSAAAASLSVACAINVAVTRTVLATPIVLATLSGRVDAFPEMLVASLIALYVTGDESIIKAARKRWLRSELMGSELMTDRTAPIERNRRYGGSASNSRTTTPGSSKHNANNFGAAFVNPIDLQLAVASAVSGGAFSAPAPASVAPASVAPAPATGPVAAPAAGPAAAPAAGPTAML